MWVYDNLFFLDETKLKQLVDLQIDKLIISSESPNSKVYEEIRVDANFETVKANIKLLFDYKHNMDSEFPKISFHYIIMKNNINLIPEFIEMACNLSKGDATIHLSRMLHNFSEVENLYVDIADEFIEYCEKIAKENSINISWSLDAPSNKPPMSQCIEWTMPFIFVNGDVIPCCSSNESNRRDLQISTSLGNIFTTPFKEIWNGSNYVDLRQKIRTGKCPKSCKECCLYESPSKRI